MLDIIWLILKIVGILVLVLIGFFAVLLYSVLFVASSYRIQIKAKDTFRMEASARWLFRAVTIRCSLDSAREWEKKLQIRLFGVLILGDKKKKKKGFFSRWKRKRRQKAAKDDAKMQEKVFEEPTKKEEAYPLEGIEEISKVEEESETDILDKLSEEEPLVSPDKTSEKETEVLVSKTAASEENKNKSFGIAKKLQRIERAIRRKWKALCQKVTGVLERIKQIRTRKEELLAFWKLEEHRRARASIYQELRYLWKKLRPKKIKGKVLFGFEDPSLTGLCMGGIGIFRAWHQSQLNIIPDFEHSILEVDVLIKGKVRFYVLVAVLWRVYFNKDIRHMYQSWQQL